MLGRLNTTIFRKFPIDPEATSVASMTPWDSASRKLQELALTISVCAAFQVENMLVAVDSVALLKARAGCRGFLGAYKLVKISSPRVLTSHRCEMYKHFGLLWSCSLSGN